MQTQTTDRHSARKVKEQAREERLADAKAALAFRADRARQMPDPLGDGDVRYFISHAPKADEIEWRIAQQASVNPAGAAWGSRKADRSCRYMTEGNLWVQLEMRKALRSTCRWLATNQSRFSNANRVEFRRPQGSGVEAAFTAPYKRAFRDHRRGLAVMAHRHKAALLADARDFYPSIQPALVYNRMRQFGASAADACNVRTYIERARTDTGGCGIPIGDESSGWLSEIALHAVHRALSGVNELEFMNWSDDFYIGDGAPVIAETGLATFQTALKELGTFAAPEKTQRSWELGITPLEMVRGHWPSHGDLLFGELEGAPIELAGKLLDVLREPTLNTRLLKSLLTLTADKRGVPLQLAREIIRELLDNPLAWEQCCPQAGAFLRFHATPSERAHALYVALDLQSEGMVGSEQRVALFRLIEEPSSLPLADRGPAARALLAHSRQADAVPEREWARVAAYRLDPYTIRRATIDTGEFNDLHSFEQRTAIAFADPRQHHWWLEQQQNSGRWPTAAKARAEGRLALPSPRSASRKN